MTERTGIDVAEVIEKQKLNRFVLTLIVVSWIVTFFDGFDMLVISFVAPYIESSFRVDRIALGQLFSLGILGTMVGGFLFGHLGDRFGRRPTIILAVFLFGLLTAALAAARSFEQLMALRFAGGIALGGMLPLCWALNIEYVPKRYRATVVTLIMLGYTVGGAVAGPVTVWIAPDYGWEGVFLFGGVLTIACAALLFVTLPESVRYLTARGVRPEVIARTVNRIDPSLRASQSDRFYLSDETSNAPARFPLQQLFGGPLAVITPLLWLAYIASSLAVFFKATWGPLVFEDIGFTRTEAALVSSFNSIGSALGGLMLMRFTDKHGPISIAVLPIFAVPLLLAAGLIDLSKPAFLAISFLAMMAIGGAHFGMHSIAGLFYPSAVRANGAGWATSVAKIGSVAAPLIGGYVLATSLPVKYTFALLAVCPLVLGTSIFVLGMIHNRARRYADTVASAAPATIASGTH